jgi:hypothetical protein
MRIPVLRPAAKDEPGNSRMTAVWQRLSRYWSVIRIERAPRQLHVRETLRIGEKRQLLAVDVGERQLLIGAAGNCWRNWMDLQNRKRTAAHELQKSARAVRQALLAIEQALGCRAEACICSSREMNVLLDKPEERFQRSNRVFDSGMVLTN